MVDNDRQSLISLRSLVHDLVPEATMVWAVDDGLQAIRAACGEDRQLAVPDVLMVDMSMELIPGKTVIRRIRRVNDTMALLAMTSFSRDAFGDIAAQAGAQGIVDKNDERDIATGLRCVADGGMYGPVRIRICELGRLPYRLQPIDMGRDGVRSGTAGHGSRRGGAYRRRYRPTAGDNARHGSQAYAERDAQAPRRQSCPGSVAMEGTRHWTMVNRMPASISTGKLPDKPTLPCIHAAHHGIESSWLALRSQPYS